LGSLLAVTTAENGQRALELLGLGDDRQHAFNGDVSISLFNCRRLQSY
jgi:hypothetical protein